MPAAPPPLPEVPVSVVEPQLHPVWDQFTHDCAIPTHARLVVTDCCGVTLSIPWTDPVVFVGSGPECKLRFTDAGLDAKHYALFWLSGLLHGLDLHRAATHPDAVVGQWWGEETAVKLGPYRLSGADLFCDELTFARQKAALSPLQVQWRMNGRMHAERLRARLTLIGSGASCSLRFHDPTLAPVQAALIQTPRSLALIHLADNDWTRRAGQPTAGCLLDPGDEFEVGRTTFRVSAVWDDVVAVSKPTPKPSRHPAPKPGSSESRASRSKLTANAGTVKAIESKLDEFVDTEEPATPPPWQEQPSELQQVLDQLQQIAAAGLPAPAELLARLHTLSVELGTGSRRLVGQSDA